MAEAIYNRITNSADAASAGLDKPADFLLPEPVLESMKEAGYDLSAKRRKQVTEEMVNLADWVIVMAEGSSLSDYLKNSPKLIRWDDVLDAKGMNMDFHRKIRDLIAEKIDNFIKIYQQ